jgi:hypothetical protein
MLQLSSAVIPPKAALILLLDGLHPASTVSKLVTGTPLTRNSGGLWSSVHVNVAKQVTVWPQSSVTVHVIVLERAQPVEVMELSLQSILTGSQELETAGAG